MTPKPRPAVAVLFTGGTISMVHDPAAGGNVPSLSGADILARTPGADAIADLRPIDLGRTPASHFTFAGMLEIGARIRAALEDPDVVGAVVVQGTDSMEETAFCWDLVLDTAKPVVVTGAMRSASDDGFDGPQNLRSAIRAASDYALRGEGVVVCMAGEVHGADDVTKVHSSAISAFGSPNLGPIGTIAGERVVVARRRASRRHVATNRGSEDVHLITATVGMDGRLIDAARSVGADGLVVAATGDGNTTGALLQAATRAMDDGLPVALTSRCVAGRPTASYAFAGGGATWIRAGALLAGSLSGPKARVALALGIGAGLDRDGLAALLDDPVSTAAA